MNKRAAILKFNKQLRDLFGLTYRSNLYKTPPLLQLLIKVHGKDSLLEKLLINLDTPLVIEEIEIYTTILNNMELAERVKYTNKRVLINGKVYAYTYDKKEVWYIKNLKDSDLLVLKEFVLRLKGVQKLIVYHKKKLLKNVKLLNLEDFFKKNIEQEFKIEFYFE